MKDNRGFVLVETIVSAIFVLGLFSFLIANILPLIGEYEKSLDYDSIESKYDAHLVRKMILKDGDACRISNLVTLPSKGYYLFEDDDICGYLSNINYCQTLLSKNYLDVDKIILTSYDTTSIKDSSSTFDRYVEEYINYMPKFTNTTVSMNNALFQRSRRLIIFFNDGRVTNIEVIIYEDRLICGGTQC